MTELKTTAEKGRILLQIARSAIAGALGIQDDTKAMVIEEDTPWLQEKGACFVTLTQQGQLRGCIGTLEAHRSLLQDVRSNAVAAAFKDTRFTPLSADEFSRTRVEVSLLSSTQSIEFSSEQQALEQLRPGIDGVIFEYGYHRSTFLPQVWDQLPDSTEFMAHLKQKAGLPANFWDDEVKLSRYTVDKWKEQTIG
ncbi:MAG: AmmeMemoRadiSam system protein A [Proteobacteria bacterium]|nr:AmmeMemoRadiSam system protein A [Pseudomonadota bacterium]